ncbi:MAG: hypothetical protein GX868_10930 [Actinobacteria bacterium]|nr:hypothetical protein [Actinomycetota bacterium]
MYERRCEIDVNDPIDVDVHRFEQTKRKLPTSRWSARKVELVAPVEFPKSERQVHLKRLGFCDH